MSKECFLDNMKNIFKDKFDLFLKEYEKPSTHGFLLNIKKASKDEILKIIDFDYENGFVTNSYKHCFENIGKSKAYELGLIYPQGIEASIPSSLPEIKDNMIILDMCSAPGGKTIGIANRVNNSIIISNEFNYKRSLILSSNIERMGIDNIIITNKDTNTIANQLSNSVDVVFVDVPCSGEGMIRKYPEIYNDYSNNEIINLSKLQKEILENAYRCLKNDGQLVYSTCTFNEIEDENQVYSFIKDHPDMKLINMSKKTFLDGSEGQFYAYFKRYDNSRNNSLSYLKTCKNDLITAFIKKNLNVNDYYLYKHNDTYYISLIPLFDLGSNIIKIGVKVGDIINNRFEPSFDLYRSISFRKYFKFIYDLNEKEYDLYVCGNELKVDLDDNYYLLTYKNISLGFGKVSKGRLKNKYPKGLRRML